MLFDIISLFLFICFVPMNTQYISYPNMSFIINVPVQPTTRLNPITSDSRPFNPPITTQRINPIYIIQPTIPVPNSDCFCSYDSLTNLLSCSPDLRGNSSNLLLSSNRSTINMTLTNCRFSTNRLNLLRSISQSIDLLIVNDANARDYLVLDRSSFESYRINQICIYYTVKQPVTIVLVSDDTFSSPTLASSLVSLKFDACYLLALPNTFRDLRNLQVITLVDLEQFSWWDFQREIRSLPQLRTLIIQDETAVYRKNIANVLSCNDLMRQWSFVYRSLQICSCELISFLKSLRSSSKSYQCLSSLVIFDMIGDRCELNGKEYRITNDTSQWCSRCLNYRCSPDTVCVEAMNSPPTCIPRSRLDYDIIRQRVPPSPLTNKFLFRETQAYLNFTADQTLDAPAFASITTILIDSNRNQSQKPASDVQSYHQTVVNMLERPWSPSIFNTGPIVWQNLLVSLDNSIKIINDSDPRFEFQSLPMSTVSIRLPDNQPLQERFGWKVDSGNTIVGNITFDQSKEANVTSRVFLNFPPNEKFQAKCPPNQLSSNCSNRYSITSFKTSKLFRNTDRIPTYDVLSIDAPQSNQSVTFYFDEKFSSNDTDDSPSLTNSTSNSTDDSNVDPFYDQLNPMTWQGTCMYLNLTTMIWQTDGCYTDRERSTSTSVTCTCEHLTMFTVFFSLTCATPSKTLYIFSWIGCLLSLIGLTLTLILFILMSRCRKQYRSEHGSSSSQHTSSTRGLQNGTTNPLRRLSMVKMMLFVLCILLILMNVLIFILTFIRSGRNLACSIFAAALYYITLTAFLWKLCFAIQQTLFITNIYRLNWTDRKLLIIYFCVTFTLPWCPLLIMFIKYPHSTFISSTCNFCWLTRDFLLYGLIIPILVIVTLNFILYLSMMIYLCIQNRQQETLRSTRSDQSRQMQNLRIGLFFAAVMGLSWILGFFLLIPNTYVQLIGNIFFCICNSLQGFIFAIMVMLMLERNYFRQCLNRCLSKEKSTTEPSIHTSNFRLTTHRSTSDDSSEKPSKLNHRQTNKDTDNDHIYSSASP